MPVMNACISLSLATALLMAGPAQPQPLHDPDTGLRLASYRAPVPGDVPGGRTIGLAELQDRQTGNALLIDVMAAPEHLLRENGTWVLAAKHDTIPGAVWLPRSDAANWMPVSPPISKTRWRNVTATGPSSSSAAAIAG